MSNKPAAAPSLEERLRQLVAEHLCLDPTEITQGDDLIADLGADSLDQVELAIAIEENFPVEISDEEMEAARSFGDLVAMVKRALGEVTA